MTVRSGNVSTGPGVQAGSTDILPLAPLSATAEARAGARSGTRTGGVRVIHRRVALLLSAFVAACAFSRTPPSGIPSAPARALPVPAPPAPPASWPIERPHSAVEFTVVSDAIVAARADTLAQTDTISTQTVLRIVPVGAAFDVYVNSFTVRRGGVVTHTLGSPLRAVGRFDGGGAIAFEGAGLPAAGASASAGCPPADAAALDAARDLWVRWPERVTQGAEWRDSAVVALCRDGVPLVLTLVRDYRLAGIEGDSATPLLVIERRTQTTLEGRGAIRGDTATITGSGTGAGTLRVDPATGWIVSADLSAELELRAVDTRRTQFVEQRTRTTVRPDTPGVR
jgi:hypothetical protein